MFRALARVTAFAFLVTCLWAPFTSSALAKNVHGSIKVVPQKVRIGKTVTLVGSGLPGNRYFSLILAVPNQVKPRVQQFIPKLAKTDGHGNLRLQFRMPSVGYCGHATIYAYAARTSNGVSAEFTLTGCGSAAASSPPAPPPHKKK